jgi:hypothetical protein
MRTSKQYFFYHLKDNILIFDIFDYIEELSADLVDYLDEWNLIKDGKSTCKDKVIKEYTQQCISLAQIIMNDKSSKLNCKILCFYRDKSELNKWSNYFSDPLKVVKIIKKLIKKNFCNFIEISNEIPLFQTIKGTFNNIPCVIPTGEDEEFLTKMKKKLKNPLDNKNSVGKIGCRPF